MLPHIIVYLLVFIAALFNAVMDKLKDHYSSSIWWDKTTFYPTQKDAFGKKFLGIMVLDAWHLAKTAMIILLMIAIVIPCNFYWWEYLVLYFVWGCGFNLGWNYLFKRK